MAAVGDEDVSHQTRRVVDGQDLETAPEERVGRIGNLDLPGGNFPLRAI
ncbi:MAG: hypothetical protein WKF67_10585 [Rubrobacteraceae bacterium]